MKFRDCIKILKRHGFVLDRHQGSSHRIYKGKVRGQTRLVTIACHRESDDILPETLASIIRQSGLNKKVFRSR